MPMLRRVHFERKKQGQNRRNTATRRNRCLPKRGTLKCPEGATVIDTSQYSLEEVITIIIDNIQSA